MLLSNYKWNATWHSYNAKFDFFQTYNSFSKTVDSRYLEVEGTRWNTSRYPYFDKSDVQNWRKYQTNNQISQMNM